MIHSMTPTYATCNASICQIAVRLSFNACSLVAPCSSVHFFAKTIGNRSEIEEDFDNAQQGANKQQFFRADARTNAGTSPASSSSSSSSSTPAAAYGSSPDLERERRAFEQHRRRQRDDIAVLRKKNVTLRART
jgi:hypothetical protein